MGVCMSRSVALVALVLVAGCSGDGGPSAPERASDAGYFEPSGRTDIGVYLYDDDPDASWPEPYFLRVDSAGTVSYHFGTYVAQGTGLVFTVGGGGLPGFRGLGGASWTTKPTAFRATETWLGTLDFARVADHWRLP